MRARPPVHSLLCHPPPLRGREEGVVQPPRLRRVARALDREEEEAAAVLVLVLVLVASLLMDTERDSRPLSPLTRSSALSRTSKTPTTRTERRQQTEEEEEVLVVGCPPGRDLTATPPISPFLPASC